MTLIPQKKIVVLGMMARLPVAGVIWQTLHYLVGLQRLGYDVYYVEANGCTPRAFMQQEDDDGWGKAAQFLADVMARFGFEHRWAYHALYGGDAYYGLSESQLNALYGSAAVLINLHGGTVPLPEHTATGRLVYLETDPVELQIELHHNLQPTVDFLASHCAFFTFGENYGQPDCKLPVSTRFAFQPTRQPVVLDFWNVGSLNGHHTFTTIANWRQVHRDVEFEGEVYHWSKHLEFLKFLDLPSLTDQSFELALSSCEDADRALLQRHGWKVTDGLRVSTDVDTYRDYIARSGGEFTVAKDQNVRLRTGWFSDRSATYLAAGRPVITQETGFSNVLPTGDGLFAFSRMDDITASAERIRSDPAHHGRAAYEVAREYFSHDVVLGRLLADLGLGRRVGRQEPPALSASAVRHDDRAFPATLVLTPASRWPTRLPDATIRTVLSRPLPASRQPVDAAGVPMVSIIVVALNNLIYNRLCLESVLLNTEYPNYEILVVDNGSTDGTPAYLSELAAIHRQVRVRTNARNLGFAPAVNQGLADAAGEVLILLNNDTVVPPGWLTRLLPHVKDPAVGLVGPVTNRAANEAQIETGYHTYGEFLDFARARAHAHQGLTFELARLIMFCAAMRRDTYERVGPFDERFAVAMFEDDDYVMRARHAGYRIACAEDVFIHHFGQASIGQLAASREYGTLFEANRQRFEEKWQTAWETHQPRKSAPYQQLRTRLRSAVESNVPLDAVVLVVSKGDDELLDLPCRQGWHFPQLAHGGYAGHHPADSADAIAQLEALRAKGGRFFVVPATTMWWLDHYQEFRLHLEHHYQLVLDDKDTCKIFAL